MYILQTKAGAITAWQYIHQSKTGTIVVLQGYIFFKKPRQELLWRDVYLPDQDREYQRHGSKFTSPKQELPRRDRAVYFDLTQAETIVA
jgi:hypothetical protein